KANSLVSINSSPQRAHLPSVLCISSQIVRGRVGNSIAVHALQTLGVDAWPVPAVLLSETPGSREVAGGALPETIFDALLARAQSWTGDLGAVQVGYLRSETQVRSVASFLRAAKASNPRLLVAVDPIMGDTPTGLYIPEGAANALQEMVVP